MAITTAAATGGAWHALTDVAALYFTQHTYSMSLAGSAVARCTAEGPSETGAGNKLHQVAIPPSLPPAEYHPN